MAPSPLDNWNVPRINPNLFFCVVYFVFHSLFSRFSQLPVSQSFCPCLTLSLSSDLSSLVNHYFFLFLYVLIYISLSSIFYSSFLFLYVTVFLFFSLLYYLFLISSLQLFFYVLSHVFLTIVDFFYIFFTIVDFFYIFLLPFFYHCSSYFSI